MFLKKYWADFPRFPDEIYGSGPHRKVREVFSLNLLIFLQIRPLEARKHQKVLFPVNCFILVYPVLKISLNLTKKVKSL